MRVFQNAKGNRWQYGEKEVKEKGTGKNFTLTQPKTLFSEDYYTVRRAIACENVPIDVAPERDFYVYEFSYMGTGCCLSTKIIDEIAAKELIGSCLEEFLRGNACTYIKYFFEEKL